MAYLDFASYRNQVAISMIYGIASAPVVICSHDGAGIFSRAF